MSPLRPGGDLVKPTGSNRRQRTVMKALKMSVIHVLAFIISWTPYTIMGTWSASQLSTK